MANAREVAEAAERKSVRNRWYLTTPALIIIMLAAVGPLFIMVVYSFLGKGGYGGVTSAFSTDAWFGVLLERDIFEVSERMDYAGRPVVPLDETATRSLATSLQAKGYEAVAVAFLFSHKNDVHERRVREIVR